MKPSYVVIGDPHINARSIDELAHTFCEIRNQHKADVCVILGDYFDGNRTDGMITAEEMLFGAEQASKFKETYDRVIYLSGNHDDVSETLSSVDYLKYVGIEIYHTQCSVDDYFFGHFFVGNSTYAQYTRFRSLEEIENTHDLVMLGDQHTFQQLSDTAWHIGSSRFVNFAEAHESYKQIATIDTSGAVSFHQLHSPVPMVDVVSREELEKLDERTKVRFVFKSFDQFKQEVNNFNEWNKKFYQFKVKQEFEIASTKPVQQEDKSQYKLDEIINRWLDGLTDQDIQAVLRNEFKKEMVK